MAPLQDPQIPSMDEVIARLNNIKVYGTPDPSVCTMPTAANLGVDTHVAQVTDPGDFGHVSHRQILDGIRGGDKHHGIDADGVDQAAAGTGATADELDTAITDFVRSIKSSVDAKWEGNSATAALGALNDYAVQALVLAEAGYAASGQLTQLRAALATTKANVPGVPARRGIEDYFSAVDAHYQEKKDRAETTARQYMQQTYWRNGIGSTAENIVDMAAPHDPTAGGTQVRTPGYTSPTSRDDRSSSSATIPDSSVIPHPGTQSSTQQSPNVPAADSHSAESGEPHAAGSTRNDAADRTTAAAFDPTGTGAGGGFGGDPGGDTGEFGRGGSGTRNGGPGGGSGLFAGGPIGGLGAPGGSGGSPTPNAPRSSAARPGAPGLGMPGPGGVKKEEEKVHKTPKYLYGTQHLEQYFEEVDGRKASPPVIGDWLAPPTPPDDRDPERPS